MGSIYKITNTVNGKIYIGQTICDAKKRRIWFHLAGYGNQLIKDDVAIYGKDAFDYEILHDGIIPEFLISLEQVEIARHNCVEPNGYNKTSGNHSPSQQARANLSNSLKGRKFSEEHKQKISQALKGKKKSPEHVRKSAEARKGITPHNKGKPHSDETKRKIAEKAKGRKQSEEQRQKNSKAMKGENNPMYGKKHSDKAKRQMAAKRLGMSPESLTTLIGWLLRDGWTQVKIARALRLNVNTITKHKPKQ